MKWIRSDGGYECMMVGYESGVARIDAWKSKGIESSREREWERGLWVVEAVCYGCE